MFSTHQFKVPLFKRNFGTHQDQYSKLSVSHNGLYTMVYIRSLEKARQPQCYAVSTHDTESSFQSQ
jgi:hypothetical protein